MNNQNSIVIEIDTDNWNCNWIKNNFYD